MTVIRPRPTVWEQRDRELCAQNALWERQDELNVRLALEPDSHRQHEILAELDDTYEIVAARGWQTEWERRGSAVPDTVFAEAPVPEHLQFRPQPLAFRPEEKHQEQIELELELH